jgi:thiol-disulfide isomerase/thioredoxin
VKHFWSDILLTICLLIGILWYIQSEQEERLTLDLVDQNGETLSLHEPYLIHFWSTWSKPSQRDIQIIQRFNKKHPDIQLVGVSSKEEDKTTLQKLKLEMGIYYPQATTSHFPQSIPLTVVMLNGEQQIIKESLQYEHLMELFDKEF